MEYECLAGADVEEEGIGVDAVETDAEAIRGNRETLGPVVAIHADRVDALAALDEVGTVAGIPLKEVITASEVCGIISGPAGECLRTAAAQQRIVAIPAMDRRDLRVSKHAVYLIDPDQVVAARCVDRDAIELAAIKAEVNRPVVPDIDLKHRWCPCLKAQGQFGAQWCAEYPQAAVDDVRRVTRTFRAGRVVRAAETTLKGAEVHHVHVCIEISIEVPGQARSTRRHARPGLTRGHHGEVFEVHVAVAVVITGDHRGTAIRIDGSAGNRARAGVHVVADTVTVGIADASRQHARRH